MKWKVFRKVALAARRGFTLLELLIVLLILGIFVVFVVVRILDPSQLLKQSRDSTRVNGLATLNLTVARYASSLGSGSLGIASTTYISIPDPTATSTAGDQCQGLGLPSLPSGWVYHCAASSTYLKIDGTGWVPINFQSVNLGPSMGVLPVDPANQTSTGLYYTYTTDGSKYEITGIMESSKEKAALEGQNAPQPYYPGVDALGTNLALSALYNPSGIVGYWNFDEGKGTAANDSSGNGNGGTLTNGPTWTGGKVNNAVKFVAASTTYVSVPYSSSLDFGTGSFTVSVWMKADSVSLGQHTNVAQWIGKLMGDESKGWTTYFSYNSPASDAWVWTSDGTTSRQLHSSPILSLAAWWHLMFVIDRSTDIMWIYVNGLPDSSTTIAGIGAVDVANALYIGAERDDGLSAFDGTIDDVRVYNRAYSPAEVLALYNAER